MCLFADRVFVRGLLVARAARRDRIGRVMPSWWGCRRLGAGYLFLLAPENDSFDSRYFGVVPEAQVIGRAAAVAHASGQLIPEFESIR